MLQQFFNDISAERIGAFGEFARLLYGLSYSNFTQHFQERAFRRRHKRRIGAPLERRNLQQGVWLLIEESLAMIFGRESL